MLKRLRTMLGAAIRDIARKLAGQLDLTQVFALPLSLARRVRDQRERGRKVYAPEVEWHPPSLFELRWTGRPPHARLGRGQIQLHCRLFLPSRTRIPHLGKNTPKLYTQNTTTTIGGFVAVGF
ncbi:MAG: hypothetical protein EOS61_02915 [Mesorhizobium sp.]|uniref:hypothetical protein n=1 Tax=Mesorhizobium sp. TaxID=1871066 RepID=UPI000FE5EF5D|nr:hypothetical protein [Mesorhizobium sp.]RWB94152.1 MAG: hypothetical protein EOQ57_32530 [Mesorhizobium sp.]RWE17411.1 MAG: hypothetical protein EOS61_02915 [Mesorhizobium sp.]TIS44433.1 MAG: hypothetical protein E5W96_36470 [Mesorhizobium sp.]